MLETGDVFEAVIRSIAFGGDGVAGLDGEICFIPGVLPGEKVRARLQTRKKNFCRGTLLEVIEPSADRVEPYCPYAFRPLGSGRARPDFCPGCSFQHMTYERELCVKQQQYEELLQRDAGLTEVPVLPPTPSPRHYGYRNKMVLHVQHEEGTAMLGYFMSDNHSILEITRCPLACDELNTLLADVRAVPGFRHTLHRDMKVTFRHTPLSGSSYWRNHASPKLSWLREETPVGEISVPPGSFFQVNPDCAAILIDRISAITGIVRPEYFIDLYCGVGVFSAVAAASGITEITGLDADADALKAAAYNLTGRGVPKAGFIAGKAEKNFKTIRGNYVPERTLLVADPPRGGIEKPVLQHLAASGIRDIVYISCAADTLCRDLRRLVKAGYTVRETGLIDMFPRTPHFESITWLSK